MDLSHNLIELTAQRTKWLERQFEVGGIDSIALLQGRIEFYQARQSQINVYDDAVIAMLKLQHLLQSWLVLSTVSDRFGVVYWLVLFLQKISRTI